MILDAVPYTKIFPTSDTKNRALRKFFGYIENALNVRVVRNLQNIPYGRSDLVEPLKLGVLLKEHGIIEDFGPARQLPDLPHMKMWYAICNDSTKHHTGGSSWESDSSALFAALAEALERYIWFTQDDYFTNPIVATEAAIAKRGRFVSPHDFTGFSSKERASDPQRHLHADAEYLWIQGMSLVRNDRVYIPAQVVTRLWRNEKTHTSEPMIRQSHTNGLATWTTAVGARLAGALEVIERDAYMVTWLNQLTLPRLALAPLCAEDPSLAEVVAMCERYRFKVHVVPLVIDAPTHVVMTVLENITGDAPRFSIGLKAHRSLVYAIKKSACEALRAHRGYRMWSSEGNTWDTTTPVEKIGHRERIHYWGVPAHAEKLEFLVRGQEKEMEKKEWDNDTEEEHLARIINWCSAQGFECISVPLTHSAKNPTPFHIEMIVIPSLHPIYLVDWFQMTGGNRLADVPRQFGYQPRAQPFIEAPHPFS